MSMIANGNTISFSGFVSCYHGYEGEANISLSTLKMSVSSLSIIIYRVVFLIYKLSS